MNRMSMFDASRRRKTYSFTMPQPRSETVGVTVVSGSAGIASSVPYNNNVLLQLNRLFFSGSGGIHIIVMGNKLVFSGSTTGAAIEGALAENTFKTNQTTDVTTATSSFGVMGSMSGTLTVSNGSYIAIAFNASFTTDDTTGFIPTFYRATIDDTVMTGSQRGQIGWGAGKPETVSIHCVTTQLTAGVHSVAIQWAAQTGSIATCNAGSDPTSYSAWLVAKEVTLL